MFTGLIEEIGEIVNIKHSSDVYKLSISANKIFDDLKLGDSVAVNGVCLTACEISSKTFTADVMPETINRTALGSLKRGSRVNLERAMLANGRFGGHIVSGHIDGVGTFSDIKKDANAVRISISAEPEILKFIVEKGSIAINGVSLTVTHVSESEFGVSIIPHTGNETTLLSYALGTTVNLECDVIGKYVGRFMEFMPSSKQKSSRIDMDFLNKCGF